MCPLPGSQRLVPSLRLGDSSRQPVQQPQLYGRARVKGGAAAAGLLDGTWRASGHPGEGTNRQRPALREPNQPWHQAGPPAITPPHPLPPPLDHLCAGILEGQRRVLAIHVDQE